MPTQRGRGPSAASLLDAVHGQYPSAWKEWSDATIAKRVKQTADTGSVLSLLGLAW